MHVLEFCMRTLWADMLKADCELLRLAAQHLIQLCNSNQIKSVIGICSKTLLKHPRESLQHTHLCKQKKNNNYTWMYITLFIIIRTLCCWSSFDPGCSFWRQWRDWTRRQAGSSRRRAAHIHNHCGTTKHIHAAPDQYQHVKRDISSYPCLIYLFITGGQRPVWHRDAPLLCID